MLFRVSGKLANGHGFNGRYEASNAAQAAGIGRKALNDASVNDDDIIELRSRPVKGGKSINISAPRDPNAPKRERKPRASKKS